MVNLTFFLSHDKEKKDNKFTKRDMNGTFADEISEQLSSLDSRIKKKSF